MKRNLVPIDEIGPVVRELIEERWPHGSGYEVLAEKIGYDASAIYGIAMVERATADFDLVDNTLCGLGRPDLWWGRFSDIYWATDLRFVRGIKHGTKNSYQWHRCRCDKCRQANRDSIRAHRKTPSRATWRKCLRCDGKYTPRQTGQNYCTRKCSKLASSQRWREANREQKREMDRRYQRRRKAAA